MKTLNDTLQALFTAANITDALSKLDALGVSYRECAVCDETYHLLQEDVTFWAARTSASFPVHVCIGDFIATANYRKQFFAQQQVLVLPVQVPASSCHEPVAEQLVIPEPVDKPLSAIQAALSTPEVRLAILRTERRLKNSRVKGLSS